MSIEDISTEILQKIYEVATVRDVLHLAQTSRKNYRAFLGRQIPILERAMHNSYSPISALVKLVISNEREKTRKPMGTELRRNNLVDRIIQTQNVPPLTKELIIKMAQYGKVADKWTEIYPQLRWRFGSSNRRLLWPHEQERLRRAIYHYWTYNNLFHDQVYVQFDPDQPHQNSDDPRLRILRTYNTMELVQLSEFVGHMIQFVEFELFPSNFIVQKCYSKRLPARALGKLAWGDGDQYRSLVDDIMKLSPKDFLHLAEDTSTKTERAYYLYSQGAYFRDAPATLNHAISAVALERDVADHPQYRGVVDCAFFPSLSILPFSDIDDENVRYGIVDRPGEQGANYFKRHQYANDGCCTG